MSWLDRESPQGLSFCAMLDLNLVTDRLTWKNRTLALRSANELAENWKIFQGRDALQASVAQMAYSTRTWASELGPLFLQTEQTPRLSDELSYGQSFF